MRYKDDKKADVIMFVDDAFAYGVEKGHYDKTYKPIHGLTIAGLSQADRYMVCPKENQIFYYNLYQEIYIPESENMYIEFLKAKLFCYRNVLAYMGAVSFYGQIETCSMEQRDISFNSKASYKLIELDAEYKKMMEKTIKQKVKLESDFGIISDKSSDEIKDYIYRFGLWNDTQIKSLYNLYEMNNSLKGHREKVNMTLSTELNSSLDISLSLGVANIFELGSTFKKTQTERFDVSYNMEVQF